MNHKHRWFLGWRFVVALSALMLSAGTCYVMDEQQAEMDRQEAERAGLPTATEDEVTFPTTTPTNTPTPAPTSTSTPEPTATEVKEPEAELEDPAGDVVNYNTGESVDQPEVDLRGVLVWKQENGQWVMDVVMERPADQTVTKSYSFAIYVEVTDETLNPMMDLVYGVHDGRMLQGQWDANKLRVMDGTGNLVRLTDLGMPSFSLPGMPGSVKIEAFFKSTDDSSPTLYDLGDYIITY